jgi:hypothetical protein
MRCSRCGAQAVTTRDSQYFCGRCALAHDWEEIIAIAQEVGGPPPPLPAVGPPEPGRVSSAA